MSVFSLIVCSMLFAVSSAKVTCSSGWKELIGRTGYCIHFYKSQLDYFHAQSTCEDKGGSLVTINSAFTNNFFYIEAQKIFMSCRYWLGLNKLNGDWSWIDGEQTLYGNWKNQCPLEDERGGSACASMDVENDKGKWYNQGPCGEKNCFACEMKVKETTTTSTTTTTTTTTTPAPDPCSLVTGMSDGISIVGRPGPTCAFIASIKSSKFLLMETECEERNGTLISIHSQMENDQLFQRYFFDSQESSSMDQRYWIGLNRLGLNEDDDTAWSWLDRTPVDFTNFVGGIVPRRMVSKKIHSLRKNSYRRKEEWEDDCVYMSSSIADGMWSNSGSCEKQQNMGICEVRLADFYPPKQ